MFQIRGKSDDQTVLFAQNSHTGIWTTKRVAFGMKWINIISAFGLLLYDSIVFRGPSYQGLQFVQILFISLLLILVDAPTTQFIFRNVVFIIINIVMVLWLYYLAVTWSREFNLSFMFSVIVFISGMIWGISIALACYTSARTDKETEFDLLLYIFCLNAVCVFSPVTSFDNTLHLVLDIRTFVLMFTYLHNIPKKKIY